MFFYESYHFGNNEEFIIHDWEIFNFPIHLHRCFELIYLYDGHMNITIDNDTINLSAGDMVLVFPNQLHSYQTNEFSKGLTLIFSPEYVNLFYQQCINKKQEIIVTKLSPLTNEYLLKNLSECKNNKYLAKSCLYAVCSEIFSKTKLIDKNDGNNKLQYNILNIIENNFTEGMSLRDIAKKLGYDYPYLSRYFNSQFKTPFTKMINDRRINHAAYLLINSEGSISDIAFECGYKSIRSFNRNFMLSQKKTPKEYRNYFYRYN